MFRSDNTPTRRRHAADTADTAHTPAVKRVLDVKFIQIWCLEPLSLDFLKVGVPFKYRQRTRDACVRLAQTGHNANTDMRHCMSHSPVSLEVRPQCLQPEVEEPVHNAVGDTVHWRAHRARRWILRASRSLCIRIGDRTLSVSTNVRVTEG